MVWTYCQHKLDQFIKYLTKTHLIIKLTFKFNQSSITFLDTIVKVDHDHKLYATLCEKCTDTNTYTTHPPIMLLVKQRDSMANS